MIKLRINYPKTHVPYPMSKGSTEHKLHIARLMNLKFYDELQYHITNNEVKPGVFKKVLKETLDAPVTIQIDESIDSKSAKLSHLINNKGINSGYLLSIPHTFYDKKIHQSTASIFLMQTLNFFEEVFNPKFFKRFTTIINKGYDYKSLNKFYEKNIHATQNLTKEGLEEFLKHKPTTEQIDTLQFFRYQLMKEKNACDATKGIERKIKQHYNLTYEHPADYYEFKENKFEEKFKILEEKLFQTIQSKRAKN